MKSYTMLELLRLKAEYLETLDGSREDERYDTDQAIAGEELRGFFGWLNIKENTP